MGIRLNAGMKRCNGCVPHAFAGEGQKGPERPDAAEGLSAPSGNQEERMGLNQENEIAYGTLYRRYMIREKGERRSWFSVRIRWQAKSSAYRGYWCCVFHMLRSHHLNRRLVSWFRVVFPLLKTSHNTAIHREGSKRTSPMPQTSCYVKLLLVPHWRLFCAREK